MTPIITVIDAPCGVGKTSWAIQEINEHPNGSYVFCTPLLDEIERIKRCCGDYKRFAEPQYENGRKLHGFHRLLAEGVDIAVTHATFLNANDETMQSISDGGYCCILDEVADEVISDFNSISTVEASEKQLVGKGDVALLLENKLIQVDQPTGKVTWIGSGGNDHKFSEVERLANMGRLYCIKNKLLVCVFPPEMFRLFNEVYVLTYRFESSMMKSYFDLFGLKYQKRSVVQVNGRYKLTAYDPAADYAFRQRLKKLVNVYDGVLNRPRRTMTATWYNNASKDALRTLRNDLQNYFTNVVSASASKDEVMWTCLASKKSDLKGKGYVQVRKLTAEERSMPADQKEQRERELSCWVPCNCIATNAYRHRWAMAYATDIRHNPLIHSWLESQNIAVNEDAFSLSCFLQWLCRSRVRDGQPVTIYIPSERIRRLFAAYLDEVVALETA